jgi:hypothetical protein
VAWFAAPGQPLLWPGELITPRLLDPSDPLSAFMTLVISLDIAGDRKGDLEGGDEPESESKARSAE